MWVHLNEDVNEVRNSVATSWLFFPVPFPPPPQQHKQGPHTNSGFLPLLPIYPVKQAKSKGRAILHFCCFFPCHFVLQQTH